MVELDEVMKQLKKIDFDTKGWGKSEIKELPHILLPDEIVYEAVNGLYDGGFALLVATDVRLLLIDKKPLNYLTVEDMRFDMISQMDYNHRLIGAEISIAAGSKRLRFRSYNQQRLRDLIGHVQRRMADTKKQQNNHQEGQILHLESINKQLQSYLIAQSNYQAQVQSGQSKLSSNIEPPKPSDELKDYLFAQSLLAQHKETHGDLPADVDDKTLRAAQTVVGEAPKVVTEEPKDELVAPTPPMPVETEVSADPEPINDYRLQNELYKDAVREVYGENFTQPTQSSNSTVSKSQSSTAPLAASSSLKINLTKSFDVNPMHIAYAKLPMALRTRRYSKTNTTAIPVANVNAAHPSRA